jgi:hypothetical protein
MSEDVTVYVDSSAAIEYFTVDGLEAYGQTPEPRTSGPYGESPEQAAVRELIKGDARWKAMAACRRAYLNAPGPKAMLVTSPLAVLELQEWYAETVFRSLCIDVAGPGAVQRRGKKEIGDFLAQLRKNVWQDGDTEAAKTQAGRARSLALDSMLIVPSFLESHGLRGIHIRDLADFSVTQAFAYGVGELLAYLQVGLADILHLCAARHLGCTFFAAFDSDFRRAKSALEEHFGLALISSPEELQRVILRGN